MAFTNPDFLQMVTDVTAASGSTDKLTLFCNAAYGALLKALSENYPLSSNAQNIAENLTAELVANVDTCITIVGLE
jgi:hypothetical protein